MTHSKNSHYVRPLTRKEIDWTFYKGIYSFEEIIFYALVTFAFTILIQIWNISISYFANTDYINVFGLIIIGTWVGYMVFFLVVLSRMLIHSYYKRRTDKLLKKNFK